jgi:hypothetical protein
MTASSQNRTLIARVSTTEMGASLLTSARSSTSALPHSGHTVWSQTTIVDSNMTHRGEAGFPRCEQLCERTIPSERNWKFSE